MRDSINWQLQRKPSCWVRRAELVGGGGAWFNPPMARGRWFGVTAALGSAWLVATVAPACSGGGDGTGDGKGGGFGSAGTAGSKTGGASGSAGSSTGGGGGI